MIRTATSDVDPEQARSWLRQELLDPAYHQENLLQRLMRWAEEWIDRALAATSGLSSISFVGLLVVLLVLALVIAYSLSRFRSRADVRSRRHTPDVLEQNLTAAELLARAQAARDQGLLRDAAIDAFRAAAVAQVERGTVAERPGATAHEVAAEVHRLDPDAGAAFLAAADLFDIALYSDRSVVPQDVDQLLQLARAGLAVTPRGATRGATRSGGAR